MLLELLAADGEAAAEVDDEDGVSPPYWALTIIGRNTAVKARENFMIVKILDCQGIAKTRGGMVHMVSIPFFLK